MTPREAAIVTAYTGFLCGDFHEFHKYAEEKFGQPILTGGMAFPGFAEELQKRSKDDFCAMEIKED